ncbi:hypothetical protein PAXRUDRAFT_207003 [Paxillus rubicundulus Ve08.2h10]|uniref:Uncharacterized protein n=1 Tax=Paxillus rubicundulus Ve08.2h10 TaxID=930991 RepID=A0A0D0DHD1_9AGAM|nr:hypothetical protein PAXRUDRAFT_207003 [Paxillus rubicundulus Ve08.2h10]
MSRMVQSVPGSEIVLERSSVSVYPPAQSAQRSTVDGDLSGLCPRRLLCGKLRRLHTEDMHPLHCISNSPGKGQFSALFGDSESRSSSSPTVTSKQAKGPALRTWSFHGVVHCRFSASVLLAVMIFTFVHCLS